MKGNRVIIVATLPEYEDDAAEHTLHDVATYVAGDKLADPTVYGNVKDLTQDLAAGDEHVSCAFQSGGVCDGCDGLGWVETTEDKIERCDACKRYSTDVVAQNAASNVIEILKMLNSRIASYERELTGDCNVRYEIRQRAVEAKSVRRSIVNMLRRRK